MSSLLDQGVKDKYRMNTINDPLAFAKNATDCTAFPPLLKDCITTIRIRGPNIHAITMLKIFFPQSVFNMVDKQAEAVICNMI